MKNDNNATHYKIQTSTNGSTYSASTTLIKSNLILSSLTPEQVYYIKIAAYNSTYSVTSTTSEILGAVPCNYQDSLLIINGFDRASTGNTYDFIKQHGGSFYTNNHNFSSATNEAVTDGLVTLPTYKSVDWILGEESTTNETFNTTEQILVANYLKQGGKFLTSGSEIAWDLDYSGNAGDKSFINTYLKASYLADAPNGQAATWYKNVNESSNSVFNFSDTVYFDNGTNGTYNVDYPDVLTPLNGGVSTLRYTNNTTSSSAIYFSGMFPSGTASGKMIYFGFPLETIYNSTKRNTLFQDIWRFFFTNGIATTVSELKAKNYLAYPNPSCGKIMINCSDEILELEVLNLNGQSLQTKACHGLTETIDLSELPEGIYFVKIKTDKTSFIEKVFKIAE